jgi:hypothetical protein
MLKLVRAGQLGLALLMAPPMAGGAGTAVAQGADARLEAATRLISLAHVDDIVKLSIVRTGYPHGTPADKDYQAFFRCAQAYSSQPFRAVLANAAIATMTVDEVKAATQAYESERGRKLAEARLAAMYDELGFSDEHPQPALDPADQRFAEALFASEGGAKTRPRSLMAAPGVTGRLFDLGRAMTRACASRG